MSVIQGGVRMPTYGPHFTNAVPSNAVNEVQTLTIGGTPTGGTFTLSFNAVVTGAITWSATNATLLANLQAALNTAYGTGSIAATAGTLTAGIGTILLTFGGAQAQKNVATMTVANNSLTGTSPTLAIAETTPGSTPTYLGMPTGALLIRTDTGALYVNTGTPLAPTWAAQV